jgi:RimJ/RimL family protein N-acetyltransferase
MILETDRLILRPLRIEDTSPLFTYRSDSETNKYQGWIPKTMEEVADFIIRNPKQFNLPETWFQLALTEKKNETFIGDIGVHFFGKENKQVELGCTLNKKYQNKGYATEALTKVIDCLFLDLKKHRIITSIDPQNTDSIRLVERIGFRKEGHFIKSLFLNNVWVDDIIYALIEDDWLGKR